jgi:hypothetical protein
MASAAGRDYGGPMASVTEHLARLIRLGEKQLFFVGGAPRSGTTWMQSLLDSHPDVSCRGEGLLWKNMAVPLEKLIAERRQAIEAKNARVFKHAPGYPLPTADDQEYLLGTGILLALERQSADKPACRAVGEKTPENIFFFPRLKQLFPKAKFIGIARDPRDVLTSAWHFFCTLAPGDDEIARKTGFVTDACGALDDGFRKMLRLIEDYPADVAVVTYERLLESPAPIAAHLFNFLGVAADEKLVADCVARTSFAAMAGRPAGQALNGSFFRRGVAGDWRSTLTPEMNTIVLRRLGWAFPRFGWAP